jgi:superfamily II DNA or RNA helicase
MDSIHEIKIENSRLMLISPAYMSDLINFNSITESPDWSYDPKGTDMRNLQVKGAARIYNLLEEHRLGLLADEVGMGKTIQALSVCAALWNEKPGAKILILAPRDEIVRNWEKEYRTFIKRHYRHNDNIVKTIAGNDPTRKMIYCQNLYELVRVIQQGWGQLFIGKISSFSSLMAGNLYVQRLEDLDINHLSKVRTLNAHPAGALNAEIIRLLKQEIMHHAPTNKPYFDLVIIDEAHYFRRKDGDSLRVQTATEFFGDPWTDNYQPVAQKTLLLTATPNHSSSVDINNIVSYFTTKFRNMNYAQILNKICVRRLRRLSIKGLSKYNYRDEKPSSSDFKNNPMAEMFFGLYQHELAKEISRQKEGSAGGNISRMMKYLEGVEFIPFDQEPKEKDEEIDEDAKSQSTDYSKGTDTHILTDISSKYRDIFGQAPGHPKYDKLVNDLTEHHQGEKAVVFVRRIPSVLEISKRIIEYHDKKMWPLLQTGNLATLPFEKLDRKTFKKQFQSDEQEQRTTAEDSNEESTEEIHIPSSKVFNLFKVVKNDAVIRTDASNFRLRFTRSKQSIFALFFSPAADYMAEPYSSMLSCRFRSGQDDQENYYFSALIHRTHKLPDETAAKDILSILLTKQEQQGSGERKEGVIDTLFTIFWRCLTDDTSLDQIRKDEIIKTYQSFSLYEKEAFSHFIEKGSLLASESILHFYRIFRRIPADEKMGAAYRIFCNQLEHELTGMRLYRQIIESILSFRTICAKVFSINSHSQLLEESWDSFNNAQPIYPYNAKNTNQKILRCFNTPFYPDFLVATSVLQEGVNLQYFCKNIYHYGMAWTPGDNEQRIGRIDRMFGKIERELEQNEKASLHIYYPYLKDTIDEEQLARFTIRKHKEELLIDQGKAFEDTSEYLLEENDNVSWKQFLRKPELNDLKDPFPVRNEDFDGMNKVLPVKSTISQFNFFDSIGQAIRGIHHVDLHMYVIDQQEQYKILVDPFLRGNRSQPVIVELVIDPVGTGLYKESVYCLRMRTPLAPYSQFKYMKRGFLENKSIQDAYLPGIKLCLDPGQTSWGIYMSTELPLFVTALSVNPLSVEEIQHAFVSLITCADLTEHILFNKDLKKEELNLPLHKKDTVNVNSFRAAHKQFISSGWREWNDFYIKEEKVTGVSTVDTDKNMYIKNHENLYVKHVFSNGQWYKQVSILNKDAYLQELNLLEKHLEIVR